MDFKILCIEDDPSWVDSIRGGIEDHLARFGYKSELIHRENNKDIDQYLVAANIDLIMVDYNLHEGKGDELIRYMQEKGNFTEVIFYSADAQNLDKDFGEYANHIHKSHRNEVLDYVLDLCTYAHHRNRNFDVMRGLMIAESIELEVLLEEIMEKTFGSYAGYFRSSVLGGGAYDFMDKHKFVKHYLEEKHNDILGAQKAASTHNAGLKKKEEEIRKLRDEFKPFDKDVISPRNMLAHGKKVLNQDGNWEILPINKSDKKIVFTKEWVAQRRVTLVRYREILRKILSLDIY